MNDSKPRVVVTGHGQLRPLDTESQLQLRTAEGEYLVRFAAPGFLILHEERFAPDALDADRPQVLLAGELGSASMAAEIVSMITQAGWEGELTLDDGQHLRRLGIDRGVLTSASSNAPGERLGEVMVALGALDQAQVQRCLADPRGGRLGEIAVRQGLLDKQRAFELLGKQAQRVFGRAVMVQRGHYTFVRHPSDGDTTVALHLPLQGLLLDSMTRVDEMANFRQRIPSGDLCPRRAVSVSLTQLPIPPDLRRIAELCDGKRSIIALGRELSLDEFEVTKAVAQLMSLGCVELKQPELDHDGIAALVGRFNVVLSRVGEVVAARTSDTGDCMLRDSMGEGPLQEYFGKALRSDGTLDAAAVVMPAEVDDEGRALEELRRALHQLTSFAIFTAGPVINRDTEKELMTMMQQRLR